VVWADHFSILQRNIQQANLMPQIEVAGMTELVRLMTRDGTKTIWHT
jgi:predicted O-methyltransferase YrrM